MFDDLIGWLIAFGLFGAVGWLLGIIAFFSARHALGQNRRLALRLEAIALRIEAGEFLRSQTVEAVPSAPVSPEPSPSDLPPQSLPEPEPEPASVHPEAAALPASDRAPRPDLEALLTMRWGVWLGAAALLLAGVFLVRYAADEGWLGPATRSVLAALLGVGLVAGAEWLRRRSAPDEPSVMADQAPSALAAGGVAVLFGAAYGAGVLYGLVSPLVAFVLLAAAALLGLTLSLRYGQLVAAIGIAGALATPALVQTTAPSLPGLFAYLLFVSAAALAVVRSTAWSWLGWTTTVAGALWVVVAVTADIPVDAWAPALFVPASAALNLFLLPAAALDHPVGRRLAWVPFAALGCAGLLIEVVVPGWAGVASVLLLSPVAIAKGALEPRLDRLAWLSALLFLLMLLCWALPAWQATGEAITIEGVVQAVLPGAWAPEAILPLLWTAILTAAAYAAVGVWLERRAPRPTHWSALTAAVPVLTMAVTYAQVALFQPRPIWAGAATLLAALLTGAAALAMREPGADAPRRAGIHAAGAVAALAMAMAMLLSAQWLTLAVALFLPPLAWIEERTDLPALRRVALAVAALVLVRLLLNWQLLGYDFGDWPVLNLLLPTYGVPALAFAWTARELRRRGDDLPVAVLEAGSVALGTAGAMLLIRHWAAAGVLNGADSDRAGPLLLGVSFLELGLQVSALAIIAAVLRRIQQRAPRPVLDAAWRIVGTLALAGGVLLLVLNPALLGGSVGSAPLLDALLPAYALPAVLAGGTALGRDTVQTPGLRRLLAGYALLAGFVWATLEVHHLFNPLDMDLVSATLSDAELWAWSGAWLAIAALLMAAGIRLGAKSLRLAAIALLALTAAKVFVVDMGGLAGLWRVLSFLGLGLTLIGLGSVYRRFVRPAGPMSPAAAAADAR